MLSVLNTQLFRLKKSKLFWAMIIVCAALPLLGVLLTSTIANAISSLMGEEGSEILQLLQGEGGYLTLMQLGSLTELGSDPALFSLIASSIFLSGEFTSGAIRNMVLANKNRTQIFLSFLCVALIIGFACFGASYVSTLLFYGVVIGFDGVTVAKALTGCFSTLFLGLLTIALVQACVCFFLFVTRKTGGTVAFPLLVIIFAPSVMNTIVNIVTIVKAMGGQTVSAAALSWVPLYNMSQFQAASIDGALIGKIVLYNAPLAALFAFFGWFALDKSDIK